MVPGAITSAHKELVCIEFPGPEEAGSGFVKEAEMVSQGAQPTMGNAGIPTHKVAQIACLLLRAAFPRLAYLWGRGCLERRGARDCPRWDSGRELLQGGGKTQKKERTEWDGALGPGEARISSASGQP